MVIVSVFFASLVALAQANPLTRRAMVVHESRANIPSGFTNTGPAPDNSVLELRIALKQNNPDGLTQALTDVSTPGNKLYGQHLTKEEVEALVSPTQETVQAVNEWLSEHGITAKPISPAGEWISFSVTAKQAGALLDTEFSTFEHTNSGKTSIRTLAYSIPANLADHVDLVHPTVTFTRPRAQKAFVTIPITPSSRTVNLTSNDIPDSCSSIITPACVQALYNIPATSAVKKAANGLAVSGFIDQFANKADLNMFLTDLRTDIPAATVFTTQTLDDGANPQSESEAGIEADLDTQYTIGVATGVPVTFISVGDDNDDGTGGFLDLTIFLSNQKSPPQVLSTSYGENEEDISINVASNLCSAYKQLGARGTSILFASGDGGVAGDQVEGCSSFIPTFPSGCPFMTSVGATGGIPETAASFSSGGFSEVFAQPSYQASAVSAYLTTLGKTNRGLFQPLGRAFPDVAAVGVNVEMVFQQEGALVNGTSASSPIFASIIALINDQRAAAGKGPLGFLNPFLYGSAASTFTDITVGNNPGCGTKGFPATAGWDPVTGLGTPNFPALLAAALAV